jgi:NADH-quinone oxidoreductase subunit J
MTVEFLALTQFLIYGGAVTVLVLLALMLTRADPSGRAEKVNGPQAPFALLAGAAIAAVLLVAGLSTEWVGNTEAPTNIAIETISQRLFEDYGLPFILASVLLLVALIGAIIVARQEEGE